MDRHPLDLERFIGWISFALGVSALQENDSTFYRMAVTTWSPLWIWSYCVIGLTLVITTYTAGARCRMLLLMLLLLIWCGGLGLVISSGPLGAYGAVAIVMIVTIIRILWTKARGETIEASSS